MEYKGYMIYVMHFNYVFQYLFADKKGQNIFQDHVIVKPTLVNLIKNKLGFAVSPFSKQDLETGEQLVLSGAMKTIDALVYGDKSHPMEVKESSRPVIKRDGKCTWRAVTLEDNATMAYQCVLHGDIVPIVEGEEPNHLK